MNPSEAAVTQLGECHAEDVDVAGSSPACGTIGAKDIVYLTREEERILDGEEGEGSAKAMKLLVTIGEINDAQKLIPIKSAQIAGVSYKTMGDAGLEFIEDFSKKAEVVVKSTLNPAGMDLSDYGSEYPEFRKKQLRLVEAYSKMGIERSCTCTPYLVGNRPHLDDHLAWSESSAVSFANSALGARTNREGGPSALMAGIIGKTSYYGLHLKENRAPEVIYKVDKDIPPALLGYHVGNQVGGKIPYFNGIKINNDGMKSLGAAMAATGAVALYHVEGMTPEAADFSLEGLEKVDVTREDIDELRDRLTLRDKPEAIVLGCPHLSSMEMERIAKHLDKKKPKDGPELRVYTSRWVKERSSHAVAVIEKYGKVIADTCMVVSPLEELYGTVATDSGKAVEYLPKLAGQRVIYADLESLLELIA